MLHLPTAKSLSRQSPPQHPSQSSLAIYPRCSEDRGRCSHSNTAATVALLNSVQYHITIVHVQSYSRFFLFHTTTAPILAPPLSALFPCSGGEQRLRLAHETRHALLYPPPFVSLLLLLLLPLRTGLCVQALPLAPALAAGGR